MKSTNKSERIGIASFATGAIVVLASLAATGCTSRQQYAINEAILISERRQLEDEIYRAKFELRDALRENERLRAQLEKEGLAGSGSEKPREASAREAEATRFPGGDALRVDPSRLAPSYQNGLDPDQYDASPTNSSLPDFMPAPAPPRRSRYSQNPASGALKQVSASEPAGPANKTFGAKRPIVQTENEPSDEPEPELESEPEDEPELDARGSDESGWERPEPLETVEESNDDSDDWAPLE
ncbi:MAG: hypothetical protein IJM30_04175 [Thermoguttaceae bacterium]|nr:hypothetical protein [Thermoguttaceae bacterium]